MQQYEKEMVLKDICARLPYNPYIFIEEDSIKTLLSSVEVDKYGITEIWYEGTPYSIEDVKPYLRPMSSMTEEELKEFYMIEGMDTKPIIWNKPQYDWHFTTNGIDYLLSHHFDFRGLIPMGLAIEAPDDMYKIDGKEIKKKTMITEDYVSFESAKLLKEKGFDEECQQYYGDYKYPCPTLQMAMKWLREEKKMGIEINTNFDLDDDSKWHYEYGFCIFQLSGSFEKCAECDYDGYKTYEEACEAAIQYCLKNLI